MSEVSGDEATQPSLQIRPPNTQVSPTVSGKSNPPESPQFDWNDATVGTSPPPKKKPSTAANPTVADNAPAEPLEKRNRFTTLGEHRRQAEIAEHAQSGSFAEHRSAWLLGAVLVGIVALCVWGLWPISADSLFARIQATVSQGEPADAMKDIESFVRRFPDDERFAEVDGWRRDVECQWLASRLGLRKRKSDGQGLAAYESRWLAAYHVREKDLSMARHEFEGLLEEYRNQADRPETLVAVLDAAEHLLLRLPKAEESTSQPGVAP